MATISFDKHPHITYCDLTKLFWSQYPYRVTIEMPEQRRRRFRSARSLSAAIDKMLKSVDYGDLYCQFRTNSVGHNFFFDNERDAAWFIDANQHLISTVVRPRNAAEVSMLLVDQNVSFRETLYHGRYSWRVTFAKSDDPSVYDQFVNDAFDYEHAIGFWDRLYYTGKKTRYLYLRDEEDVIMTRLSFDDIHAIDHIVLRETVNV